MSDSVGGDAIQRLEEAAERETRGLATRAQVHKVDRRSSRRGQITVALSLLIAIVSVLWSGYNTIQISHNETRNALTREGVESLEAANAKLKEQGLPEIPLPREGEEIDADAIAAAAAALMYDRIRNDPKFRGEPGATGPSGLPGAPCVPQVPQCIGPTGPSGPGGSQGPEGASGRDGADAPPVSDGQIQGQLSLFCSQDPSPCVGPTGPQGPPGVQGAMGPEGPFCPDPYTPQQRMIVTIENPLGEPAIVCAL